MGSWGEGLGEGAGREGASGEGLGAAALEEGGGLALLKLPSSSLPAPAPGLQPASSSSLSPGGLQLGLHAESARRPGHALSGISHCRRLCDFVGVTPWIHLDNSFQQKKRVFKYLKGFQSYGGFKVGHLILVKTKQK